VYIRESLLFYPLVETTHVLTLCLFLGMTALFDLRLLGVALRSVAVSEAASRLLPWARAGFTLMAISGILLFYSGPVKASANPFFRVKMALITLAGLNATLFHLFTLPRAAGWDQDPKPPARARLAGLISLVLWSGVVICGRLQAYNWFD
jgi:hypothetical protein